MLCEPRNQAKPASPAALPPRGGPPLPLRNTVKPDMRMGGLDQGPGTERGGGGGPGLDAGGPQTVLLDQGLPSLLLQSEGLTGPDPQGARVKLGPVLAAGGGWGLWPFIYSSEFMPTACQGWGPRAGPTVPQTPQSNHRAPCTVGGNQPESVDEEGAHSWVPRLLVFVEGCCPCRRGSAWPTSPTSHLQPAQSNMDPFPALVPCMDLRGSAGPEDRGVPSAPIMERAVGQRHHLGPSVVLRDGHSQQQ